MPTIGSKLYLPADQRGVVVFKFWQSLGYDTRLLLSFVLIFGALAIQLYSSSFFPGGLLLIAGNLLLLVNGYDNRINYKKYDPASRWERVDITKLREMRELDRKIKKWDASFIDITSAYGVMTFLVLMVLLILLLILLNRYYVLILDAMVLLLPHWFTGSRKILRKPRLLQKVNTVEFLLKHMEPSLKDHRVELLMLLKGKDQQLPDDIKFKVDIRDRDKDFLGLYGQVVLNLVQGKAYPYFYMVLVAKDGYGLKKHFQNYRPPVNVTKELKRQDKVEVLVIRQTTSRTSGYHTSEATMVMLFQEGLQLAEKAARMS
ncbi:MAG: hypothetical protein KDI38_16180 [Calditrichaeota bacterium]|nr:hypothetical protein [Calditrichota bacterium]